MNEVKDNQPNEQKYVNISATINLEDLYKALTKELGVAPMGSTEDIKECESMGSH